MGTSGAYGGTSGWIGTQHATEDWLDSTSSSGGNGESEGGNGETSPDEEPSSQDEDVATDEQPDEGTEISPSIANILSDVTRHLSEVMQSSEGSGGGGGGAGSGLSGAGGPGGGGKRRSNSAVSGGTAIAGAYGVISGSAGSLDDIGLSLDELSNLGHFEQAKRLVDTASEASSPLDEDEIRMVNSNFVLWAINQDDNPPEPEALVKEWVIEFVYRTWLTEAGAVLRNGSQDGASTHALEQEVRATLEAAASRIDLPTTGLRATHFQAAVQDLLGQLNRIFTEIAA